MPFSGDGSAAFFHLVATSSDACSLGHQHGHWWIASWLIDICRSWLITAAYVPVDDPWKESLIYMPKMRELWRCLCTRWLPSNVPVDGDHGAIVLLVWSQCRGSGCLGQEYETEQTIWTSHNLTTNEYTWCLLDNAGLLWIAQFCFVAFFVSYCMIVHEVKVQHDC